MSLNKGKTSLHKKRRKQAKKQRKNSEKGFWRVLFRNPEKRRAATGAAAVLCCLFIVYGISACSKTSHSHSSSEITENSQNVSETETAADAGGEENENQDEESADVTDTADGSDLLEKTAQISITDGTLKSQIQDILSGVSGIWSVYIKNLNTDEALSLNDQSMYAASLIKLFVMEDSFRHLNDLVSEAASRQGSDALGYEYVMSLLSDMIELSDNEAYNELIRLHSDNDSFIDGCLTVNENIQESGYTETGVYHTLIPSDSDYETTGGSNQTSVCDCGALLEAIYNGTCVSESASEEMLSMLLLQETDYKIPAGVPSGIRVANKTGETDETEHDAAIVYGPMTDYILCVMSSETTSSAAIETIKEISSTVYEYLNHS